MYRIGEFSKLSKTTIKTIRYYEKEGLLTPHFIDVNNYRYYTSKELIAISKIINLRQLGFSIDEIRKVISGADLFDSLKRKKQEIELELDSYSHRLTRINYLLEEKNMKYEVREKEIHDHIIFYKEGVIEDYSHLSEFILKAGEECLKLNPSIKCEEPDYCYVEYLDKGYKEKDVKIRYSQAVTSFGKEDDCIKFKEIKKTKAISIFHIGSYSLLGEAYSFIYKYIEDNNIEVAGLARERYIDGIWDKESEDEYLTEIEVPIK